MKAGRRDQFIATAICLSMLAPPALARTAGNDRDLVGARASSGEMALENRGYTHIATHEGKYSTKHSYWWHSRDKNCLHVETYDGRYAAISDGTRSDCHQKSGGNGAATAGAIAGVALLGALLASKSHHRDNKNYGDQQTAEFDRGYKDGLYNTSYHNSSRSDAYADGYQAGVDERSANLRHHSGRGGYAQAEYIADIKGMDAVRAFDVIRGRGFENVDAFSSGNTNYGIYYNKRTGQCIQTTNADNRVYDIRDIGEHPNCH